MSNIAPLDLAKLEADAKKTASKHVANMIQRPDQLEKIDQYRRRYSRKKASVEAMLKTAVQSQLDGVRTGLLQLQAGLQDVKEIKKNLTELDKTYQGISDMAGRLAVIREENNKNSQLAAAVENLKHIFTVPDTVKRTEEMIKEGKLLHAHKSLMDLEASRDDLLFEVHKQPTPSPTDKNMVHQYFKDIPSLNEELSKQLWLILKRTLQTVRREPTIIVTALRIIEREERTDQVQLRRKEQTGFIPPGRPKQWKKKCISVLDESVLCRIQGSLLVEREDDKMWLVKHLELIRQNVIEDIRVAKTLCPPVFPPEYNIGETYVNLYHKCIAKHLEDLVQGLEGNEYVSILTWINQYQGPEMMGHYTLKIDVAKLGTLLTPSTVKTLENQYLQKMRGNFDEWMNNSLAADKKDWDRDQEPEADGNGYFNTQLPVILCQMIEQNLQVAAHISSVHLVKRALALCCDELKKFAATYSNELQVYKGRHLLDRREPRFYIHYMIANVNNCQSFTDFIEPLKAKFIKDENDSEGNQTLKAMGVEFDKLANEGCKCLREEVLLDLRPHLQELVTHKWLKNDDAIDTILITVEDYCQDFVHLKTKFFDMLMLITQRNILGTMLRGLIASNRKMTFKNSDERRIAADKIEQQAEQLQTLFFRLAPCTEEEANYYQLFSKLAEIIRMTDSTMLQLELSSLITAYPQIQQHHVVNLLTLREDVSKSDATRLVAEVLSDELIQEQVAKQRSHGVFQDIT